MWRRISPGSFGGTEGEKRDGDGVERPIRLQFYFVATVLCWKVFWDIAASNPRAYRLTHYVLYCALLLFVHLGGR